jgi:hypothetical protein
MANHTWSHCISDNWQQFPGVGGGSIGIPGNRRYDRGDCSTRDQRHVFNLSGVFQSPQFSGRAMRWLLGDWQLSPIIRLRSGQPFSVTAGVDNALSGIGGQRPDVVAGENPYVEDKGVAGWLRRAAFASPPPGTYGNLGANTFRGPGQIQIDVGLSRTFDVGENKTLQFRAESFNLPNHANLNDPVSALNDSNFGRILSAGDPRIFQFALKLAF